MTDHWRRLFEQMRELGKSLIVDDIDDFGKFKFDGHPSPLHHWQYGLLLWLASEYLTLANIFVPFNNRVKDKILEKRLKKLEDYAKQRISLPNRQNAIRRGWQIYTSVDR